MRNWGNKDKGAKRNIGREEEDGRRGRGGEGGGYNLHILFIKIDFNLYKTIIICNFMVDLHSTYKEKSRFDRI